MMNNMTATITFEDASGLRREMTIQNAQISDFNINMDSDVEQMQTFGGMIEAIQPRSNITGSISFQAPMVDVNGNPSFITRDWNINADNLQNVYYDAEGNPTINDEIINTEPTNSIDAFRELAEMINDE